MLVAHRTMTPFATPRSLRPEEENSRLAALAALDLIDSDPERDFDAIVSLAATLFGTHFAGVSLLDSDRMWLKSRLGFTQAAYPRETSICTWAIGGEEVFVVPDAESDQRFEARRAWLGGQHNLRFYAGAPIHAPSGERVGILCVGDPDPRAFDPVEEARLRELAVLVDALIAARAMAREAILIAGESARQADSLQRQERVMHQAERLAMMGSWRMSLHDNAIEWSDNTYRIHGLPVGREPSVEQALEFYPPYARATVAQALATTIETGAPMDIEVDFVTAQGLQRKVRSIGELETHNGQPVAVVGVFQDVTERWALEQTLRRSADRDELTGIANRAAFNRALETALDQARTVGVPLMLALIDLDGFKATNDTLGHLAGDDVLKAVGRRLEQPWLKGSLAARLGGDEFALIVTDGTLVADPRAFAARLERDLAVPVTAAAQTMPCAGTVGTALFDPTGDTVRDIVHRADTVLYAAKRLRTGDRRRSDRRAH